MWEETFDLKPRSVWSWVEKGPGSPGWRKRSVIYYYAFQCMVRSVHSMFRSPPPYCFMRLYAAAKGRKGRNSFPDEP